MPDRASTPTTTITRCSSDFGSPSIHRRRPRLRHRRLLRSRPRRRPLPRRPHRRPCVNSWCFFDFDSSEITPQARAILTQAVNNARQLGNTRIVATGHADRSGTVGYNAALSQRRAEAVQVELVRLGMNAADIQTVARGESNPLVPTGDGVREPQKPPRSGGFELGSSSQSQKQAGRTSRCGPHCVQKRPMSSTACPFASPHLPPYAGRSRRASPLPTRRA